MYIRIHFTRANDFFDSIDEIEMGFGSNDFYKECEDLHVYVIRTYVQQKKKKNK